MVGELRQISQWSEAAEHLNMLIGTIRSDLFPLRHRDHGGFTESGAPHTISREFSCYVDYLGSLYTGEAESERGDRFEEYLREVLGEINPLYANHCKLIREMYRNGPVHEFDPKTLFNRSGDHIGWMESTGSSPGKWNQGDSQTINIRHLNIIQHPNHSRDYYLPVFTSQLLDDLIRSIELFEGGIGDLRARVISWNRAAAILNQPKRFDWSK
ncbi:MAG: hypothetical protein V1724_03065 [Chloroflexota bacterium]